MLPSPAVRSRLPRVAEACTALSFPVVSGNVSLYNETNGVAIPPTPAIGGIKSEDGTWIEAKRTLATGPSVLFDAVAVVVALLVRLWRSRRRPGR